MSFWLAVLAATAGNVVGSLIAYAIGATRVADRVPTSPPTETSPNPPRPPPGR